MKKLLTLLILATATATFATPEKALIRKRAPEKAVIFNEPHASTHSSELSKVQRDIKEAHKELDRILEHINKLATKEAHLKVKIAHEDHVQSKAKK